MHCSIVFVVNTFRYKLETLLTTALKLIVWFFGRRQRKDTLAAAHLQVDRKLRVSAHKSILAKKSEN